MVNIANKDFNSDMDRYLKTRRDTSSNSGVKEALSGMKKNMGEWDVFSLFRKKKDDSVVEEYEDDEDFVDEESEIEAIDEFEEDLEERRESALKRFFKKLRFGRKKQVRDEDDYYEESVEEDDELDEIKDVIKITHRWLEELPPEVIDRFKRSEDFVRYKQVLKKLGMIK